MRHCRRALFRTPRSVEPSPSEYIASPKDQADGRPGTRDISWSNLLPVARFDVGRPSLCLERPENHRPFRRLWAFDSVLLLLACEAGGAGSHPGPGSEKTLSLRGCVDSFGLWRPFRRCKCPSSAEKVVRSSYLRSPAADPFTVQYGYYLPIMFQSAQGVSTTESGLRYITLVGPQIVALVIVGGIVSKWGYYVSAPRFPLEKRPSLANMAIQGAVHDKREHHLQRGGGPVDDRQSLHADGAMGCIPGHYRPRPRYGGTASLHGRSSCS